jgi:haloalkane dehalogenase
MHFVELGAGDPLLMVHGNPTWSFYFRRLLTDLGRDFRPIAIDHVGCGLSDKPVDYPYCLKSHIDNLCSFVDQLRADSLTLIGHDWGGAIGLGTVLKRRDKFKRIVLLNTGAFPPDFIPFRIQICRFPVLGRLAVQGLNLFARAAMTMATQQPGGLAKNVAHGLLAPYDSWQSRTAIHRFVQDIPRSPSHPTWHLLQEIESQLPTLSDLPILLVWGMKDWCFRPSCLRRFQSYWPNAATVEIESAGHFVIEDAPDLVVDAIRQFCSPRTRNKKLTI